MRDRALTTFERRALSELPTAPRELACRSCPGAPLRTFEHAEDEVTARGVVRWWRCTTCRTSRSLDVITRPLTLSAGCGKAVAA